MILRVNKLLERFTKDKSKRIQDRKSDLKKVDKLYVKWKGHDNSLIVGLIKKISLYKMNYFPEPHTLSKNEIKVELDLSTYSTKSDIKNARDFDISKFAKNTDLGSLKSDVDELGIDKLKKFLLI